MEIYDFSGLNPIPIYGNNIDITDFATSRNINLGDTVGFKISLDKSGTGKKKSIEEAPTNISLSSTPINYSQFFKVIIYPDNKVLDIETTDSTNNVIQCWVNLSDLITGEKFIKLWVNTDTGITTEGKFTASAVGNLKPMPVGTGSEFYLHQSISSHFRENIAVNGSISSTASPFDRGNITSADYLPVGLQPVNPVNTKDVSLWQVILEGTNALSFKNYIKFMDFIFCGGANPFSIADTVHYTDNLTKINNRLKLPFNNVDAYHAIKVATEAFVVATVTVSDTSATGSAAYEAYLEEVTQRGLSPATFKILPYMALIRQKLPDLDFKDTTFDQNLDELLNPNNIRIIETCYGLIKSKLQFPCFLELIWNYWLEESMMVQGMATITRRFQNIRGEGTNDPLANVEIGPLRPLNNLLWGYIQDEQHRLTVRRRAYEYDHHYGLSLQGTAVKGMRTADSRSKFMEAFHTLLNLCVKFYKQYDDTTVVADGFPIMNALKEVHMILSEGAHNQYGDLPSTARIEMLMQQYILARPEFREFLPTRQMVAYPEAWMDRVAVLNTMHGWTKTNVMHFRDLAMFGEQIVLSIRFGAWSDVFDRDQAANWAIFWRAQIQNYIHAYRAATGVDLSREDGPIDALPPSIHLLRRLKEQNVKVRI